MIKGFEGSLRLIVRNGMDADKSRASIVAECEEYVDSLGLIGGEYLVAKRMLADILESYHGLAGG